MEYGPGPKAHGPRPQEAHSPSLLYPHVFSEMGGRQDDLLPCGFSPCAYEVSFTYHLPEKHQELDRRASTSRAAAQPKKLPKQYIWVNAGSYHPSVLPSVPRPPG